MGEPAAVVKNDGPPSAQQGKQGTRWLKAKGISLQDVFHRHDVTIHAPYPFRITRPTALCHYADACLSGKRSLSGSDQNYRTSCPTGTIRKPRLSA
jgi:hypothetical protein